MGRVEQIWIKRVRLGPMDPVDRAQTLAGRGLVGNANQRGRRQVTLLSREHWHHLTQPLSNVSKVQRSTVREFQRARAPHIDPVARRANLLLSDIDLTSSRHKVLRIGAVRIRILGETRPCERMDEAVPGLRAALSGPWGGGAFGEILDDGEINVGDAVTWE